MHDISAYHLVSDAWLKIQRVESDENYGKPWDILLKNEKINSLCCRDYITEPKL